METYARGIPTYKGENGQTIGLLCETKEQCITDDNGVRLSDKLQSMQNQIGVAPDFTGYATETYVDNSVSGLATEKYVDDSVSSLATKAYVDSSVSSLPTKSYVASAVSGLATETYVNSSVDGLAKTEYVDKAVTDMATKAYVNSSISGLATEGYVNNLVAGLASEEYAEGIIDGLATEEYVDSAVANKATTSYVDGKVTGLATETYVNGKVSGLATETYVNGKVSSLASKTYVDTAVSDKATTASVTNIVNGTTTVGKATKATTADSATKATSDGAGNNIVSTYSTKVEVEAILAGIESGETATGNAAALGGETSTEWQTKIDAKVPKTRKVNGKALTSDITLSASDVGADASGSANSALTSAKAYTDTETASTLTDAKEYADSVAGTALTSAKSYTNTSATSTLKSAKDYTDAEVTTLETAIGKKADQSSLNTHTGNTTVHITAAERTAWNAKATTAQIQTAIDGITSGTTIAAKATDADKLDGYHADDFLRKNNYRSYTKPWIIEYAATDDFNTMQTRGMYTIGNLMSNNPVSSEPTTIYGYLNNILSKDIATHNKSDTWLTQEFITTGCRIFFRQAINADDFSPWREFLHTGNSAPCVVIASDPGIGASVSYADGTLLFVKGA
jgi:antitoxin component YwqK of YwqJK toxin-antitoxin module